jgi:hypothetical protein
MNTDFRFLLTLLAAASLTLTACGDSEDPTDGQDAGMDAAMDVQEDMGGEDMGNDAQDMGGDDMGNDAQDMGGDDMGMDPDGGGMGAMTIDEIRALPEVQNLEDPNAASDPTDGSYTIEDVVVTAVNGSGENINGVWVQEQSEDLKNKGLYLFFQGSSATIPSDLSRGDVLTATGPMLQYYGLLEMTNLTDIEITTQDGPVPDPVVISDVSTIVTGGADAEAYEGVLIEVSNQTVAEWDPTNNNGEATFDSGLYIDTDLYNYPDDFGNVMPDDVFSTIRGPLSFSFNNRRILPREQSDLVLDN